MPEELQKRLQPDIAATIAPCGLRRSWVPTREAQMSSGMTMPLLDFYCFKPGCLTNGGKCTGIRLVPEPTVPLSMEEARSYGAISWVPIRVLRGITKHVRQSVADQLHRPNDPGLRDGLIADDITVIREAHRREMRKGGTYV